jgi:hypothetical protein
VLHHLFRRPESAAGGEQSAIDIATLWPVSYNVNSTRNNNQPLSGKNRKRMSGQPPVQTKSAKLKNALSWMGATLRDQPERQRQAVVQEAAFRFDLTPAECEFLDQQFSAPNPG